MLSEQRRAELEKMGQAPLAYTQWTNSKEDRKKANDYFTSLRDKSRYEGLKKAASGEFVEGKDAIPNEKQQNSISNKLFPSKALYRYLLRPIRETFLELFSGKRVATNLLKLLAGALVIGVFVAAVFFFPPIAPFFTIAALATPVGIATAVGVIAPFVLGGLGLLNSVIYRVEKFARKRHWDRYENFRSTVKRWHKAYNISENTLSDMNAYLFNKLKNAQNTKIKEMLTKLIDKKLDSGNKSGAHAVAVFFATELETLVQTKQERIAEISKNPFVDLAEDPILIALEKDINTVKGLVEELKSSTLPKPTLDYLKLVYAEYESKENKAMWKQGIESQMERLQALLDAPEHKHAEQGVKYYKEIYSALGDLTVVEGHVASRTKPKMVFSEEERQELAGWLKNLSNFKDKLPQAEISPVGDLEKAVGEVVFIPKSPKLS